MNRWRASSVRIGLHLLGIAFLSLGANGAEDPSRSQQIKSLKSSIADLPTPNLGERVRRRLSTRLAGTDLRDSRLALEELRLLAPSPELLKFAQELDLLLLEEIKRSDESTAGELDRI